MDKRNKIIHRYPVITSFPIDDVNIKNFKISAQRAATQIEKENLHRIDREAVKKIAEAYPSFIRNLSDAGCDFGNLPFRYMV